MRKALYLCGLPLLNTWPQPNREKSNRQIQNEGNFTNYPTNNYKKSCQAYKKEGESGNTSQPSEPKGHDH